MSKQAEDQSFWRFELILAAIAFTSLGFIGSETVKSVLKKTPTATKKIDHDHDHDHDHEAHADHDHDHDKDKHNAAADHDGEDHSDDDHDEHKDDHDKDKHDEDEAHEGHVHIDKILGQPAKDVSAAQTQAMDLQFSAIAKADFVKYSMVSAHIEATNDYLQPVFAPISGTIVAIHVRPGQVVKPGQPLATMLRSAVAPISLPYIKPILKPSVEVYHSALTNYIKLRSEVEIIEQELSRLKKFTKSGSDAISVLPGKLVINMQYELTRAKRGLAIAKLELHKHGLDDEQIESLLKTHKMPQISTTIWLRNLRSNGLWNNELDQFLAAFSKPQQDNRWFIAAIAELYVEGLLTQELRNWISNEPAARAEFLTLAALAQQGSSLAELQYLNKQGALSRKFTITAPHLQQAQKHGYEIQKISIKSNQTVTRGENLFSLSNSQSIRLKITPVGDERRLVKMLVKNQRVCSAKPLIDGSGPDLNELKIQYIASSEDHSQLYAYCEVENSVLSTHTDKANRSFRSWQIEPGIKYLFKAPIQQINQATVVPKSAILYDQGQAFIFLTKTQHFSAIPIQVLDQNPTQVLIKTADDKALKDFKLVTGNILALHLALQDNKAATDAHGHSH